MAFEEIDCVSPVMPLDGVPRDGIRFLPRKLGSRRNPGEFTRYIELTIGKGLATRLHLQGERSAMRLLFGTGEDAGKIAMTVDRTAGKFVVKARKNGTWTVTINAATADGLFALDFPAFCVEPELAALPGKPTFATCQVSPQMLAVAD